MVSHEAFKLGNVAVITGAADGIGYATAKRMIGKGMRVCLADIDEERLDESAAQLGASMAEHVDVSDMSALSALRDKVLSQLGRVDVLMNNAGTGGSNSCWTEYEVWQKTLGANLWGVINGVHAFTEAMLAQNTPGLIINTGSKQGITTPPGNPAYNVSKAGIKSFTEALQHTLRNTEGCQLSAHLLVPGFTYTGMIRRFMPDKPPAAWTAEQVVEFMLEKIDLGDFYILCPDNDVNRDMDNRRMEWAMGDLIYNRPALSRWHEDYEDDYREFTEQEFGTRSLLEK
ncbi:MAG: SDR family NAD(P)-dependent oxidoreductase [Pseudomonadales bacterium]